MKKLFSFLAIIGIILASNCSRIPENNDPVIGVWSKTEKLQTASKSENIRNEWIFNDVYLGRFHQYKNNKLEIVSDFNWNTEDDVYTISYPGLESKTDDLVVLKDGQLMLTDGTLLANRQ